jgi:ComF family protein
MCPRCASAVSDAEVLISLPKGAFGCSRCAKLSLGFGHAVALNTYEEPLRSLCLKLKSRFNAWLCGVLVDLLFELRGELMYGWRSSENAEFAGVVPVPLHWRRQITRGYNQSEVLGRRLAKWFEVPLLQAVRRVRPTRKLASLPREDRLIELRGAFRCKSWAEKAIAGRDLLLVDDILTTGATCGAIAKALRQRGARRVFVVVLGRVMGTAR